MHFFFLVDHQNLKLEKKSRELKDSDSSFSFKKIKIIKYPKKIIDKKSEFRGQGL